MQFTIFRPNRTTQLTGAPVYLDNLTCPAITTYIETVQIAHLFFSPS